MDAKLSSRGAKLSHAVIPAAGLGLRLRPLTLNTPKALLPIGGCPALSWALLDAYQAELTSILVVIQPRHRKHFERALASPWTLSGRIPFSHIHLKHLSITWIEQSKPLGLMNALSLTRPLLQNRPFAVLLPDEIMPDAPLSQLCHAFCERGSTSHVLGLHAVTRVSEATQYGVATLQNEIRPCLFTLRACIEKPAVADSPWVMNGRYIFTPKIWAHQERVGLTEVINGQLSDTLGLCVRGPKWDIGSREGYKSCCQHFASSV